MNAWIIRPYPHHIDRLGEFLAGNFVAIGWPGLGNLGRLGEAAIRSRLDEAYADQTADWRRGACATIMRFIDAIEADDYVIVTPRIAENRTVAIGVVAGSYEYDGALDSWEAGYPHHRPVRWLIEDIPRDQLPDEVVASMRQGTLNRTDAQALANFVRGAGIG